MKYRLTYCYPGSEVIINELNAGTGALENLTSLGISAGDKIKVVSIPKESGPVNIVSNGNSVTLGRELASKIIIESDVEFKLSLAQTKVGDIVEVTKINSNGDIRYRLLDMGLVRGVKIKIIRFAPLGDPVSIELNGFNLTLRLNEAESIDVKMIDFGKNGVKKKSNWWN